MIMTTQKQERYTNIAILLHWLMAVLIIILFALGWYMVDLPKGTPERSEFFALHKSIGLTVAILALIRLLWYFSHPPPALPASIPLLQQKAANILHHLLYLMMFMQPFSGYISSSFSGYKTKIWGIPLPHWGWKDKAMNELFTNIHEVSSIILLVLIALHLIGVIIHLLPNRKRIFQRMLPSIKSGNH